MKELKVGNVFRTTEEMLSSVFPENSNIMIYNITGANIGLIGKTLKETSHATFTVKSSFFKTYKDKIEFLETKLDISRIKEELDNLIDTHTILPENQRIDEEVFNYVKEGKIPSEDQMRILLLKYHKALDNAERNVHIIRSFIDEESTTPAISEENDNEKISTTKISPGKGIIEELKSYISPVYGNSGEISWHTGNASDEYLSEPE